ncbi:hypothetical protein KEJ15_00535 [Candidatus Bathyarchaeota archaeon]|nr:hypothetical protein [Candidatus Bathyarchaeota archaeon]
MVKARRIASTFIGGIQCVIGGFASALSFLIYINDQLRNMFSITFEEVYLIMFILLVFGMISILSGMLLVWEGNGG